MLSDGNGLQSRIRINGSRLWNFNYIHPITGKRVNMGLGTYPEISLSSARKMTVEARELVAKGIDPRAQRDSEKLFQKKQTDETLIKIARQWFDPQKGFSDASLRRRYLEFV